MTTMSDYALRFSGIQRLYGTNGAEKIRNAHFCIIGIGGVGSWIAEALARNGAGAITLVDLDDICTTNINRQIHALTDTVGLDKIAVMGKRIHQINPECIVHLIEDFVTEDNLSEVLAPQFDFVFDAIDSVSIKTKIIAFCKRNKQPVITIGGAGGKTDPSKIQLSDLSKTYQDPLLAKVRNQLRREHNFSRNVNRSFSVSAVFSSEQLSYPNPEGEVCQQKQVTQGGVRLDCTSGFGSASHITATFAFFAVGKALNKMLGKK